jgi:hypothetical protein
LQIGIDDPLLDLSLRPVMIDFKIAKTIALKGLAIANS